MAGLNQTRPRRTTKVVETEEDVEEGALLGESTLAKLSATRKPEDIAANSAAPSNAAAVPLADPPAPAQSEVAAADAPLAEDSTAATPDVPGTDGDVKPPEAA